LTPVTVVVPAVSFGYVRRHGVGRPYELAPNRLLGEVVSVIDGVPHDVANIHGALVHNQLVEWNHEHRRFSIQILEETIQPPNS